MGVLLLASWQNEVNDYGCLAFGAVDPCGDSDLRLHIFLLLQLDDKVSYRR